MADPKNPEVGSLVFDGEEFAPYLVDLQPGELQGMRTEQPGFDNVNKEVVANHAEWGAKAGVTEEDFNQLQTISERIERIDLFVRPLQKFLEMLIETRYVLEDRRQRIVLNIAQSVDRRGVREPILLAKYEKTRSYRSAIAKKAVRTRRRNAALATQAEQPAPAPVVEPIIG